MLWSRFDVVIVVVNGVFGQRISDAANRLGAHVLPIEKPFLSAISLEDLKKTYEEAIDFLKSQGEIKELPLKNYVAAVSVGLQGEEALLDLNYEEDFSCGADTNFVVNNALEFVEVQGTAEGQTITRSKMDEMMDLAILGCQLLFQKQAEVIGEFFPLRQ